MQIFSNVFSLFLLHLWSNCVFLFWTNNKSNCYFFWIWASHSQVNCRLIKAMDENLPCSSYIYPLRMWCLTEPLSGGLMFLFLEIKLLQFNSIRQRESGFNSETTRGMAGCDSGFHLLTKGENTQAARQTTWGQVGRGEFTKLERPQVQQGALNW